MSNQLPAGVFCGNTVRRMAVSGLRISETVYPPSLAIPPHSHELANFCLVLRGGYTEAYERRTRSCEAATLIFHPSGEVHSDKHQPTEARILCIEVEQPRLQSVRDHSIILDTPVDFQGGVPSLLGARLYAEFCRGDDAALLAIEGLALEIMAAASRRLVKEAPQESPAWLRQAEEFLRAHFSGPLALDAVAEGVRVHPVHLARVFRRRHGCTVGEYVRRLRVEAACRHLAASHMSLGEIALAVGFCDQSHFSRTFKGAIGVTPAEYRRIRASG